MIMKVFNIKRYILAKYGENPDVYRSVQQVYTYIHFLVKKRYMKKL